MANFALKARWVLPVSSPPIDGGVVTIADERIVAVGTRAEVGVPVQDLGEVVLLPGLINAHTHLEFSELHQPLGQPGMALPEWICSVIASRKQQTDPQASLLAGLQESGRAGVTTIGDIVTSAYPKLDWRLPGLTEFHEVIGFSAGRVESVFAELQTRLESGDGVKKQGISPHAPYTVHPELVQRLVAIANERELPIAMHLAESPEELQLLRENAGPFRELLEERSMWDGDIFAGGKRPLDYLRLLSEAPRALVIHGNYLELDEIEFVAQQPQMTIVYCPRTHAYFQHVDYPLRPMLQAGVRVAVGTDSRASNPNLSVLDELRHIAREHGNLSPEQILRLGTLDGAFALEQEDEIGSLEVGKLANLTVVDCGTVEKDASAAILFGKQIPMQTWIRGAPVAG